MRKLNADDHYIYYCGLPLLHYIYSIKRNGVAIIVNKWVHNAVLMCNLKNDRMNSLNFQGKPFNITVIQVYDPTTYGKDIEVEQFYEDTQDILELEKKKKKSFSS